MANKDLILTQQQADGSFLEKVLTPTASQVLSFDGGKDPISALAVDTTKLPLAGGTMSGNILMDGNNITGAAAICSTNFHGSAANLTAIPMGSASGNLAVSNLNSGTGAGAGTFWRGDGTWAAPAGGGGGPIGWDAGTTCTLCTCTAGHNIASANSNCAAILGGHCHTMCHAAPYALIAGGNCNCLSCGTNASSIVSGCQNYIECSCYGFLGGGLSNKLQRSDGGVVVGGTCSIMYYAPGSSIGGGYYNCIYCSAVSVMGGGCYNNIDSGSNASGILGGKCNKLCCSNNSFVVGSCISVNQKDCWAYMNNLCVNMGGGCLRACVYYAAGNAGQSGTCNGLVVCNGIVTGFV